ncbi:hypothetical protein [Paraburkholderia sp. MM6662-R1]|uniref:hypothetical protein n=1 Tax=Paraburkholderia sp. MM6662-R1 TaxID=2991066 RepID=UPI003D1A321B
MTVQQFGTGAPSSCGWHLYELLEVLPFHSAAASAYREGAIFQMAPALATGL